MLPNIFGLEGIEDIDPAQEATNTTWCFFNLMRSFGHESLSECFETRHLISCKPVSYNLMSASLLTRRKESQQYIVENAYSAILEGFGYLEIITCYNVVVRSRTPFKCLLTLLPSGHSGHDKAAVGRPTFRFSLATVIGGQQDAGRRQHDAVPLGCDHWNVSSSTREGRI